MGRIIKIKKFIHLLVPVILITAVFQFGFIFENGNNLSEKVKAAIASRFSPADIEVTVKDDGWVNLEGKVSSLYNKYRIFELASHVNGVKRITNDIIVDTKTLPDQIIKHNVKEDIERNSVITEPDKINISVNQSQVKLSGTVSFYREKLMARTAASWEKGVKGIVNDIKVKPIQKAVTDQNLENILQSILRDEFPLTNPNNIHIKVKNGFATVSGTVSNLWTKRNIKDEFSSVIGIVGVINKLNVNPDLNS